MTTRARETVVLGKDSIIRWALSTDGKVIGSEPVTRVDLVFKRFGVANVTISSNTAPQTAWFVFADPIKVRGKTTTTITVNLKDSELAPGLYRVDAYLYDVAHPDGTPWDKDLEFEVRAAI